MPRAQTINNPNYTSLDPASQEFGEHFNVWATCFKIILLLKMFRNAKLPVHFFFFY